MGWVYAFWTLGFVALLGIGVDGAALRVKVNVRSVAVSLGLKACVVVAFGVWAAYFAASPAQGWEDLASFAGILVLSVPALLAAVVLDVLALRRLLSPKADA